MAGAGYKLFTTGDVLTAAQVNTYLQEQTVMAFADSAARTSALSAVLAEGMMSYLKDTDSVEVYDGSAWAAVGGSSPLTTKGDLYGYSTLDARIPIGTNNQVLTADSAQALGLKWASAASPSYTWTTWTPALKQSVGVTYTNRGSKYIVVDKLFIGKFILQISSAGTANNQMMLSLPLAFPAPYNTLALGVVEFYDGSAATFYSGNIVGTGSTSPDDLAFESGVAKTITRWGLTSSDCAIALASGDFLSGTIVVELT